MKQISIKTGETLTIREAIPKDAAAIIAYAKTVGDETNFLTFSADDFTISLEDEQQIIEAHRRAANQLFIVGLLDGAVISVLNVKASSKPRLAHYGEFGIGVVKAHWGKGVGGAMIEYMIAWARESGIIRKIQLRVLESNVKAIQLYTKLGFEVEGKIRRDLQLDGVFYDAFSMGLVIDEE